MRILIVEDEPPAAKRLMQLLQTFRPGYDICAQLDSVQATLSWMQANEAPDLAFFDIQLADGLSFDILKKSAFEAPVIFTTAYDQYTLRAFKHNSVDYLLKPIDDEELEQALDKFERLFGQAQPLQQEVIQSLMESLTSPSYKSRFIIKVGQQLSYIAADDICYFYSEDGIVFAQVSRNKRHAVDYTLDALMPQLDPQSFFRLNRKVIAHINAVDSAAPYFNGRWLIRLQPPVDFEVAVSRDRAAEFKQWLDS